MSTSDQPSAVPSDSTDVGEGRRATSSAERLPQREFTWTDWFFGVMQRTFLLLVLYVLSFGPLYWHWYGGRFAGGNTWMVMFYEPLFVAAQLIPSFGKWMDWYVNLWIG